MSTAKTRRRELSVDSQFERLQAQWRNGQSGAGAWFWQHFKPVLLTVHDSDKELHLQCMHCAKLFSARNPSRTSLEHLKSGACTAFRRTPAYEEVKTEPRVLPSGRKGRKGVKASGATLADSASRKRPAHRAISAAGSTEMGPQEETRLAVMESLGNLFLESGIPLKYLSHPRLLEMCHLLGVVPPSPQELLGNFLEVRCARICEENEARMRKAGVYQIAADGWKTGVVCITINFQDGQPTFLKSVEVLQRNEETLLEVMGAATEDLDAIVDRRNCVGWITDLVTKNGSVHAEMEERYPWILRLTCQAFAVRSLMKDLMKHIKVIAEMVEMCQRIVRYFHGHPTDLAMLRRKAADVKLSDSKAVHPVIAAAMTLHSVWVHQKVLQSFNADEDEILPRETEVVVSTCLDAHFWNCVSIVHSLLYPILATYQDIVASQPHFSQMLDMWMNLETLFRSWSGQHADVSGPVMDIFHKRFDKSYHPAMAAAYVLDPGFCVKQCDECFLPDWQRLQPKQQSDAMEVLKKVAASNRSGRVSADFARWKAEGLPSNFRSVVSNRSLRGDSCLSVYEPMALRRTPWSSCLKDFEALGVVAHRLLSLKATVVHLPSDSRTDNAVVSPPVMTIRSKMEYIQKNVRLINACVIDERQKELDLVSDFAIYGHDKAEALPEKPIGMEMTMEEVKRAVDGGSQLYMQQLQLSASAHLPPAVLRMTPPPLGTMPELPLNRAAQMTQVMIVADTTTTSATTAPQPTTAAVQRKDDSFYEIPHTGTEQLPNGLSPDLDASTEQDNKND